MTELHGFELVWERDIPELHTRAKLFRHIKTGAELLSMENDDENKVFGVAFRTLPEDSSGVPHILEHAVLSGSKKYPVKEPFVELLKGSLHTFINAITFPDKTVYPVASINRKDFYNLVDVYLDAVFHPNITPDTLKREGWHYEFDEEGNLIFKGVVFNEMKGAYSSPDNVMGRWSQQAIFPDTVYGVDSGGDPSEIPNLTYEQFRAFYDRYYHPSNALIWFYGDDDTESRLALVNSVLKDFDRREINAEIALQPRFEAPRHLVYSYDAAAVEDETPKALVTVNWLLTDSLDAVELMSLYLMSQVLLGTSAAPLQKALIDSGLGEEVIGGGLQGDLRQTSFSVGLRGVNVENAHEVEHFILAALRQIVQQGIDPDQIEATINTYEFRLRELNTGGYPKGLLLLFSALNTWLYGGDPLASLAFERPLQTIKDAVAQNPRYFEELIQRYLLDNTHRATVLLKPDAEYGQQLREAEAARLDEARAAMTEEDIANIQADVQRLIEYQNTPDSPEALATIPRLTLDDLDREVKVYPCESHQLGGVPTLYHELHTNGIFYVDVAFNLFALPPELLPYYSLFEAALVDMGTTKTDFVKLTQRIGQKTGGISTRTFISHARELNTDVAWAVYRGKATLPHVGDLLDILRETLLEVNLSDRDRLRQILLEQKSSYEAGIIPSGHVVAMSRLAGHLSLDGWADEQLSGIDYLFFLRRILNDLEHNWEDLRAKLETVRDLLLNRQAMLLNVTVDAEGYGTAQPHLAAFAEAFPAKPFEAQTWPFQPTLTPEGLLIPAQVNYVAKGGDLFAAGYQLDGSAIAIKRFISLTHLWNEVRLHGGAYGGGCSFDMQNGVFAFWSYRDPNLDRTLAVYDATPEVLRQIPLDEATLTSTIIGAVSELDKPLMPDAKGFQSLVHHWLGITDALRQQRRDELLSTTAQDFKDFADALAAMLPHADIVVIGSEQQIEQSRVPLQKKRLL